MAQRVAMRPPAINSAALEQSVSGARNILKFGFTIIALHRGLVTESDLRLELATVQPGHSFPSLRDEHRATHMIHTSVFSALSKGYLREVTVIIYDVETLEPLETYPFVFEYGDTTVQVQFEADTTSERCRAAFATMLSVLTKHVKAMPPLQRKVDWTLQLTYHEDRTPQDYHPPGFASAPDSVLDWAAHQSHHTAPTFFGAFQTKHHAVGCGTRSVDADGPKWITDGECNDDDDGDGDEEHRIRGVPCQTAASTRQHLPPAVAAAEAESQADSPVDAVRVAPETSTAMGGNETHAKAEATNRARVVSPAARVLAAVFFLWTRLHRPSGRFKPNDIVTCIALENLVESDPRRGARVTGRFSTRVVPLPVSVVPRVPKLMVLKALTFLGLAAAQGQGWYMILASPANISAALNCLAARDDAADLIDPQVRELLLQRGSDALRATIATARRGDSQTAATIEKTAPSQTQCFSQLRQVMPFGGSANSAADEFKLDSDDSDNVPTTTAVRPLLPSKMKRGRSHPDGTGAQRDGALQPRRAANAIAD